MDPVMNINFGHYAFIILLLLALITKALEPVPVENLELANSSLQVIQ